MDGRALAIGLVLAGLSFAGTGVALLLARRAVVAGACLLVTAVGSLGGVVLAQAGHDFPAGLAFTAAGMLAAPLAVASYPRLPHRHWVDRLVLLAVLGCGITACLLVRYPTVVATLALVTTMVLVAHVWWRIETSADDERRALVWLTVSVTSVALVIGLASFAADGASTAPSLGLLALVGPALYVGVVQPEIVDVRGLVVRAVVLSVAVVTYVSLFVGAAAALELAVGEVPTVGALAGVGVLAALTFQPLQVMLRGVVDELLFGHRPDPLDAASRVAGLVGDDPVVALRAIREALVLPYAALLTDTTELGASGNPVTHTRSFPLDGVGAELVVGLRPGDLALSPGDEQVLRLVAPLLAQTMRARALAADLQESREATITAVEEERRRLRRDLHDGLGPRLSGIAFTSDAARNLVRSDPEAADALLKQLRADTTTAIEDIRRLVYAMRPPALDELGLVRALRQQATGLRTREGRPLAVRLDVPAELPALPAAVEVAAYRIVTEALTNVARHSSGTTATVAMRLEPDGLTLEVSDDGGSGAAWPAGVGTASMRERAAELGGTLNAGPTTGGGRVSVVLPLGGPPGT